MWLKKCELNTIQAGEGFRGERTVIVVAIITKLTHSHTPCKNKRKGKEGQLIILRFAFETSVGTLRFKQPRVAGFSLTVRWTVGTRLILMDFKLARCLSDKVSQNSLWVYKGKEKNAKKKARNNNVSAGKFVCKFPPRRTRMPTNWNCSCLFSQINRAGIKAKFPSLKSNNSPTLNHNYHLAGLIIFKFMLTPSTTLISNCSFSSPLL